MKVKKGDRVLVITGKDRGKTSKVIKVLPKEGKIVVEGINIHTRHLRPRRAGQKGSLMQFPAPISVSNVKVICPKCNQSSRIGYLVENKQKTRFCKKCKAEL